MKRYPIPSSGFDCYSPIEIKSMCGFYQRWYSQGGQSAMNHAGIMKRARDYRDLRTDQERSEWQNLEWRLSQCRAERRMREIGEQKKVKVVKLFPVSQR